MSFHITNNLLQRVISVLMIQVSLDFNVGVTNGVSQPLMPATLCKIVLTTQMRIQNTVTVSTTLSEKYPTPPFIIISVESLKM